MCQWALNHVLKLFELIEAGWRIFASVTFVNIGSDDDWTTPGHYLNLRKTYFNEISFEIQKF